MLYQILLNWAVFKQKLEEFGRLGFVRLGSSLGLVFDLQKNGEVCISGLCWLGVT